MSVITMVRRRISNINKRFLVATMIVLLSFSIALVYRMLNLRDQKIVQANMAAAAENIAHRKYIIAPATIDSVADITKVPALQYGVIKKMHVKLGQMVRKGQPLFSLDDSVLQKNQEIQRIAVEQAEKNIWIQEKNFLHVQTQLKNLESLEKNAVSPLELKEKQHELVIAKAQLEKSINDKKLTQANLEQIEMSARQFTVVAPKSGVILQILAHRNEFINTGQPVIYLGDGEHIVVRVSIDEREIHRFKQESAAHLVNYSGQSNSPIPIKFMQLDQYIVVQERLNTRVQEALYMLPRKGNEHLIAGQLLEAYIESTPSS